MTTHQALWRRYSTVTKRQQIIKHAAVYMDLQHPGWADNINNLPRFGERAFNISSPSYCVIGAGSGRRWSKYDAERLGEFVKKTLKLKASLDELLNITADSRWESYWLNEVRVRVESAQR